MNGVRITSPMKEIIERIDGDIYETNRKIKDIRGEIYRLTDKFGLLIKRMDELEGKFFDLVSKEIE